MSTIEDEDFSSASEDEIEDDEGELVTEKIDEGIEKVLKAIRNNDPVLKDKTQKFFPEIGDEGVETKVQHKPMYLKDYQREQILAQGEDGVNADDTEEPVAMKGSYAEEQERTRRDLIKGFHGGSDDDDDEDGDLLQKRAGPERDLPEVALPDPEKDADAYLNTFLEQKAWLPTKNSKSHPTYKDVTAINEDKDAEDEFDEKSEQFETAYNFRFEDPESAEIVSYARDQSTLRRSKLSSRQKRREREQQEREKEEQQRKLELSKMRKEQVNKVTSKLSQLQQALGDGEDKVAELLSQQDLDGDWDDAEWDKRMQKLFDDEFYGRDDANVEDAAADGDIGGGEDIGEDIGEDLNAQTEDVSQPLHESKKKKKQKEKKNVAEPVLGELSRKDLKRKAEKFVEANEDLLFEKTIKPTGFKYREVDPESFGLSARDILLASDKDLNQFVGIKKLASYREKSKMEHDRKKFSKRKRLRQWRREVFGTEEEPSNEMWEKAKAEAAEETGAAEPAKRKKRKTKS